MSKTNALSRGRRHGRLRFLLLTIVAISPLIVVSAEIPHPLVKDVRIISPTDKRDKEVGKDWTGEAPLDHFLPGTYDPSGWGIMRYYGCVTCHDLKEFSGESRWGPDLDFVGDKTPHVWLDAWLKDPSAVQKAARMPRVPLTGLERHSLVTFLEERRGVGEISFVGNWDPVRGKRTFDSTQCLSCHNLGGEGGNTAPALDSAPQRINRGWLVAYLLSPSKVVPNTRMSDFGFDQRQAEDVAAYLLGDSPSNGIPTPPESRAGESGDGLSLFAQKGCAGCHRIGAYYRKIPLPGPENISKFLSAHRESLESSPKIELSKGERRAIRTALEKRGQQIDMVGAAKFLDAFWSSPINLQGSAPASNDSLASRLESDSCGACHVRQLSDWKSSIHSRSMGPGVMGQIHDGIWGNPGFVEGCQTCHAPASEQHPMLRNRQGNYGINYRYRSSHQEVGIDCVVCHVRGHIRYGPNGGNQPAAQVWQGSGHGGWVGSPVFGQSLYCRGCHQFDEGQRAINGKLLQDTYDQWLRSPQAEYGQSCQSCHMPGRQHSWKGIHDAETVREALEVRLRPVKTESDSLAFELEIFNRGAGHHLPTYVTPKIFVQARVLDSESRVIGGTTMKRAIGWEVLLGNQSQEVYDTRIHAGGHWLWRYGLPHIPNAQQVEISIEVHPDHFYLRVFEGFDRNGLSPSAARMIDMAAANARTTPFSIFQESMDLKDIVAGRVWNLSR